MKRVFFGAAALILLAACQPGGFASREYSPLDPDRPMTAAEVNAAIEKVKAEEKAKAETPAVDEKELAGGAESKVVEELTAKVASLEAKLNEQRPSQVILPETAIRNDSIADPKGEAIYNGAVHTSAEIKQCIDVHFTDVLPHPDDPRAKITKEQLEDLMDKIVERTIHRMCVPQFPGPLESAACEVEDGRRFCYNTVKTKLIL